MPESGSKEEKGMREWTEAASAVEVMMMLVYMGDDQTRIGMSMGGQI